MNILLVAATIDEISIVASKRGKSPQMGSHRIDILATGVGMTATAYQLGVHLGSSDEDYDLLINAGIAGSFDRSIPLGSVVQVTEDTFSELGAEDGDEFLPIETLGLGHSTVYSSFHTPHSILDRLPKCKAITVNRVHGQAASIDRLLARLPDVKVESMEGAAVFFAAAKAGIPAIQIRAISNYVERRDRDAWKINAAIDELNNWLAHFIESKIP